MDEFIQSLDLPFEGEYDKHNNYIIEVQTSNDFSDLYNCISLNKELTLGEHSIATDDESLFTFYNGIYDVKLEANYKTDTYRITISER
jgi:hypothetical protein